MVEEENLIYHYPDFFNDVFGPIMQPGSSSHTAAPCRLGYLAHNLLGQEPREIHIFLDQNGSFAGTFGIMAEDNGMLAGALGILPDDERLYQAKSLAQQAGIKVSFKFTDLTESKHVNAMKFVLVDASGNNVSLVGNSTGGGMIETCSVNGFPLRCIGDTYVLLIFDALENNKANEIKGQLSSLVESGSSERPDGSCMSFFKMADYPDIGSIRKVIPGAQVALLHPVLPVLTRPGRKSQLFDTMVDWRMIAQKRGLPLWEVAMQYQMDASCWTRDKVLSTMRQIERVMYQQTHAVYQEPGRVQVTPFKPDMASEWNKYAESAVRLSDNLVANTLKWAYGAGAGIIGVPVVAGPMGGGGGYIHAALWAVKKAHGFCYDDLLRALFVAAGVGVIAFSRTQPTGEIIGCTGECGICGAMAAAGIAEMAGGTPEQVENAASLHLQAFIGMPCDPIAGGLGQPCRSRIIAAICMASTFADLALAGRDGVLPLHEVIDVADEVGRGLPAELLCTSRGGASVTPTASKRSRAFQEWFEQTREAKAPLPPGNLI